ncbi:hypothetical protein BXOR1_07565 [Xanthomonas oryzae pv. oryzicola]|nr:hypothetical protein FE36_15120 [Xanthomonas oryzae pv. oryzicola]KOR45636.1 hypothetical protein ADT27_12650 [Xanthomonas oryzae]OLK90077.1 hypothetical protein BXOR1_07565 [Xanthomonas oryzae pv. oryzicola]
MRGFFSTDRRDASWRAIGGLGSETVPAIGYRLSAIGYRLRSMTEARATAQVRSKTARKSPLLLGLQNACTPADVKETLG